MMSLKWLWLIVMAVMLFGVIPWALSTALVAHGCH